MPRMISYCNFVAILYSFWATVL